MYVLRSSFATVVYNERRCSCVNKEVSLERATFSSDQQCNA